MKRNVLAIAMLGTLASTAYAQSTVTLFGVVDVGVMHIKNGSRTMKLMSIDGLQTSRLGFRGVEDLGGGLKAGFHIEGAMAPDVGTSGGQTWTRRSTVSLLGGFGEVRLGRDYTPTFWNITRFSPFGTNGVGNAGQMVYGFDGLSSTAPTIVRSSNSIGYFLPSNIGGVYGQAMVAAGEGGAGRYLGARVGFASGPVDVAAAYSETDQVPGGATKFKVGNIGASFKVGPATLMGLLLRSEQTTRTQDNWLLGATVELGQGELRASFIRSTFENTAPVTKYHGSQAAIGYVYNLSKRTALYTSAARIDNSSGARFVINVGGPALVAGQKSTGVEAGIKHSF
jgi:predicted porin